MWPSGWSVALRNAPAASIIGFAALAAAFAAHLNGQPITAALLAVFGVTLIGALLGVRAGVLAGLLASLTYNLLLTDPFLRFSFGSADDLVPIIALNVSAIASGVVAGRLHDRAVAAENSNRLVAELLAFSQALQQALTPEEIEEVASKHICAGEGSVQLFVEHRGKLSSPSVSKAGDQVAQEVWHSHIPKLRVGDLVGIVLTTADRRLGLILVDAERSAAERDETQSFLPLLALAVQRWLLASELSEADAVRRSEQFKTALLSCVSHDLRTPLAAISASASSLARFGQDLDSGTTDELLRTIQEQCERLDRLTTNLLNIGRIEGGLDVRQMPVVDAVEVLGSALGRVRRLHSDHRFEKDFRARSASVRAEEPLLEQVFLNVLENAAVHTAAGTRVKISSSCTAGALLVSVEDDGCGIPQAEQARVFDRFFQGAPNLRSHRGSGLGLSIAKGFAERVGGTIGAAPTPPSARRQDRHHLPTGELTGDEEFLLVDDEPAIQRVLAPVLRADGWTVFEADSARQALDTSARERIDIILLDLGLPDADGKEIISALRGTDRVAVIVLSARHQETEKVAALDAGADDYIDKPFNIDVLRARIGRRSAGCATNRECRANTRRAASSLTFRRARSRSRARPSNSHPRSSSSSRADRARWSGRDPPAAADCGLGQSEHRSAISSGLYRAPAAKAGGGPFGA